MHTAAPSGKRVLVKLRKGGHIVDKFVSRSSEFITLERSGRIDKRRVRAVVIYREKANKDRA